MAGTGTIRIGIAGWTFEPWRGEFYPKGLPQKQELAFASAALRTIEINSTFYGTQKPASFISWAEQAPPSFVFTVKGPQLVTHILKLRKAETPLANFFASGPLALGARLGPFVWQLPPNLSFDAERIETFLALLPKDPDDAARLARSHDERLKAPAFATADGVSTIRHAMEVRHLSYADPAFLALLRKYNVALVTADTTAWPTQDLTADFAYARLQGPPEADRESYAEAELDGWAARLAAWSDGKPAPLGPLVAAAESPKPRDVFAYFVSTDKVHAPKNAQAIMQRLKLAPPS